MPLSRLISSKMTRSLLALAGVFIVSGAAQANGIVVSQAPTLIPHKALYDVKLVSIKSGSQMVNISGKMFYEWKPSCEGWITNHRFSLNYDYAETPPMNISSDFTTFESFDGKSLNFSSRRKREDETYEELRGSAEMTEKGGAGKANYKIPEGLKFDLEKGILFPTGHTLSLLEQARMGKKFYNVQIFDGSDDDGPVYINSFISKKIGPKAKTLAKDSGFKPVSNKAIDTNLTDVPYWNVRMAFFPAKDTGSNSDYELSMILHENGVISDMRIEYPEFTVSQKLVGLEKLSAETCKN